jgi:hypothetical protein
MYRCWQDRTRYDEVRDKAKNNYSKIEQNMFIIWHDLTTYE